MDRPDLRKPVEDGDRIVGWTANKLVDVLLWIAVPCWIGLIAFVLFFTA